MNYFFLVTRTFKSLTTFKHNTVLLTIITVLYITFPGLICLKTGSLCLLTTFTHFTHLLPPDFGGHQSILCIYKFI